MRKEERPILTGWKLYVFGPAIFFVFVFAVFALRARVYHYATFGVAFVFAEVAIFAAIATAGFVFIIWQDARRK